MRVLLDLVVNHTSTQHPWFQSARASKSSPYRDFYVWRAEKPPDTKKDVTFPDQESSIWEYDVKTAEWYLHRFYRTQPDLNITNPLVRDEIVKAMGVHDRDHRGRSGRARPLPGSARVPAPHEVVRGSAYR
jgi:glycosidase